jgi:hypothetical protein
MVESNRPELLDRNFRAFFPQDNDRVPLLLGYFQGNLSIDP